MMPAVNGGDFYLDFLRGDADLSTGELEELATQFAKVVDCSNVAAAGTSTRWDAAGELLIDGKAATFVMGDWAKGYFQRGADWEEVERDPWVPGTDFDVVPGLGSAGYFTFNSIVFGLPEGAVHPKAASAFLEVVGSKDGQTNANSLKGSVPARSDVDGTSFDTIIQGAIDDFKEAAAGENKLLPGYASLTSYDFQVEINPSLLVFAVGGKRARELDPDNIPEDEADIAAKDVQYLVNKIKANYDLLK
ncbi:MAG TPA: hypothetical protein VLC09_19915, partial [Polyangiaceae bacterium]|nr:hypothetical protein [Polyangiaceae bacterium]